MKKVIFLALLFFSLSTFPVFAQSSYVLPYPSQMPGNFLYKIHLALEKIQKYWYFGNIGQFTYNLEQSDKYLVEAKTLFEYKQYLLGYQALEKSNNYFRNVPEHILRAVYEGKDMSEKQTLFAQAAQKHNEILKKIESETPARFTWAAEKAQPIHLELHQLIQKSINIRSEQQ